MIEDDVRKLTNKEIDVNSPDPVPPTPTNPSSSGWVPTTSTTAGGLLGGAVAQIIIAFIESATHTTLSSATSAAIATLAVFGVGYVFKDGGRK